MDAGVGLVVGWATAILFACLFVSRGRSSARSMPIVLGLRSVPIVAVLPAPHLAVRSESGWDSHHRCDRCVRAESGPGPSRLRDIPEDLLLITLAYNDSAVVLLRKVRLPTALPSICAALRVSAPLALIGALLADGSRRGRAWDISCSPRRRSRSTASCGRPPPSRPRWP